VWKQTARAILDALLGVYKISAALIAQSVQRATAKHTVEHLSRGFVARKIFALFIFKIRIVVFHQSFSPSPCVVCKASALDFPSVFLLYHAFVNKSNPVPCFSLQKFCKQKKTGRSFTRFPSIRFLSMLG
jgi:hypothetical protein